ncbi:MAG TPA: cyclase family protein [Chloroflexota bacterium]|jgi:kynurenine formamidase
MWFVNRRPRRSARPRAAAYWPPVSECCAAPALPVTTSPAEPPSVSRRGVLQAGGALALGLSALGALPARAEAQASHGPLVDLTQPIRSGILQVSGPPTEVTQTAFKGVNGSPVNQGTFAMTTHSGTHLDAPYHVIEGGATVDTLPLGRLQGPGVLLTIRKEPGGEIDVADLEAAARGVTIRPGDFLVLHTGWDQRYDDPAYLTDYTPLTLAAADWVVATGVGMLAVDMLAPEWPRVRRPAGITGLVVHERLLGNDVLIAENLRGLDRLAGRQFQLNVLPLPLLDADGAPARVFAELLD